MKNILFSTTLILALVTPTMACASEMTLACSARDSSQSASDPPYVFSILLDPDKHLILDIGGDGGGWIVDEFSGSIIKAHFSNSDQSGTVTLDRIVGAIDLTTTFSSVGRSLYERGTCEPSKNKF
jgi:hypothetical protein